MPAAARPRRPRRRTLPGRLPTAAFLLLLATHARRTNAFQWRPPGPMTALPRRGHHAGYAERAHSLSQHSSHYSSLQQSHRGGHFDARPSPHRSRRRATLLRLASTAAEEEEGDGSKIQGEEHPSPSPLSSLRCPPCLHSALQKFQARPSAYLCIPLVAAFVGWVTNYLAVQMIFYPVHYRGLPLWRREGVPLGLVGWQGIVPCKTQKMSQTMVHMVTTQLLDVEQVFRRLDPKKVADLLGPEVPKLMESVASDMASTAVPVASRLHKLSHALVLALPGRALASMAHLNRRFLHGLAVAMQDNIGALLNVNHCVIDQMMQDRSLLGTLFRKCGQKELDFLTNSGLWFGFLLGIIQMIVALFWENPWALSVGGTIVGLATNWLALKWIFEPVTPTRVGPFVLQGQFLRRQTEVAKEFSDFFARRVLTSEKLWGSILTDPSTQPSFDLLFTQRLHKFVLGLGGGVGFFLPGRGLFNHAATHAVRRLPEHLHVLHPYVDATLGLRRTLQTQMEKMSSARFERVLHPIFEEDELTLILAGGFLGFAAGLVQQGIETGYVWEWVDRRWKWVRRRLRGDERVKEAMEQED